MEKELGVRLFERTNRITRLTAAGQVLRDEARRMIVQAERAIILPRRAGERWWPRFGSALSRRRILGVSH
jgi:DNA-binding transcriptional LysR family regulator